MALIFPNPTGSVWRTQDKGLSGCYEQHRAWRVQTGCMWDKMLSRWPVQQQGFGTCFHGACKVNRFWQCTHVHPSPVSQLCCYYWLIIYFLLKHLPWQGGKTKSRKRRLTKHICGLFLMGLTFLQDFRASPLKNICMFYYYYSLLFGVQQFLVTAISFPRNNLLWKSIF